MHTEAQPDVHMAAKPDVHTDSKPERTDSGRAQKERRLKRMAREAGQGAQKLFARISTNNTFDFILKSMMKKSPYFTLHTEISGLLS